MIIQDRVYGEYAVEEPILLELLASPVLQRIKGIQQCGCPDKYLHAENFSRYEHCIGVMIILAKLGANIEEQVAGLLHDVSHTAFSHTIDKIVGTAAKENYQDSQHKSYLLKTGINTIIQKYGYDFDRIADCHHFGLLEQEIPDLCADRIDYALREFTFMLPKEDIDTCINDLTSYNNQIIFTTYSSALWFAENFLWQQENNWGSLERTYRLTSFAQALRYAIKDGTITLDDFWQDDAFVTNKLVLSKNSKIQKILSTLENKSFSHLPISNELTMQKFRYVDPLFLEGNSTKRLSEVNNQFKEKLKLAQEENKIGMFCPVIE